MFCSASCVFLTGTQTPPALRCAAISAMLSGRRDIDVVWSRKYIVSSGGALHLGHRDGSAILAGTVNTIMGNGSRDVSQGLHVQSSLCGRGSWRLGGPRYFHWPRWREQVRAWESGWRWQSPGFLGHACVPSNVTLKASSHRQVRVDLRERALGWVRKLAPNYPKFAPLSSTWCLHVDDSCLAFWQNWWQRELGAEWCST